MNDDLIDREDGKQFLCLQWLHFIYCESFMVMNSQNLITASKSSLSKMFNSFILTALGFIMRGMIKLIEDI